MWLYELAASGGAIGSLSREGPWGGRLADLEASVPKISNRYQGHTFPSYPSHLSSVYVYPPLSSLRHVLFQGLWHCQVPPSKAAWLVRILYPYWTVAEGVAPGKALKDKKQKQKHPPRQSSINLLIISPSLLVPGRAGDCGRSMCLRPSMCN